jgi:hypothetical protein
MPIKKYVGESQISEMREIVRDNQLLLCSSRRTGVDKDYIGNFRNFEVGFVSSDNGEVKGFIIGLVKYGEGYIELVCGKGHGKALINSITNWFKKNGYNKITLSPASDSLVTYYEELKFVCSKKNKDGTIKCMERELYPDDLVKNMSKLAIKPANASSSSSSSRLPSGCADLRKFSRYIKDLNDYSAADLKDFVNNCSLSSGTATTKAKAIDIIKLTVRMYKSQYNL